MLLIVLVTVHASAQAHPRKELHAGPNVAAAEAAPVPAVEAPYNLPLGSESFDRKFRKQLKGLHQPEGGGHAERAGRGQPTIAEDYGARSPSDELVGGEGLQSLTHRERQIPQWKIRARRLK